MQPLNDDMDNIFRRAAEDYPLNTNSADWSRVQQLLQAEETPPAKTDKRHLLWLLLLLPLTFICNRFSNMGDGGIQPIVNENILESNEPIIQKNGQAPPSTMFHKNAPTNKRNSNKLNQKAASLGSEPFLTSVNNGKRADKEGRQKIIYPLKPLSSKAADNLEKENKIAVNDEGVSANIVEQSDKTEDVAAVPNDKMSKQETKDSSDQVSTEKKKQIAVKTKKLYAGILIGPDLSSVKTSKIKGAGYSFGLLVGYSINSKISIESGLLWDEKKYYSKGEYFNTKNMQLPDHVKVIEGDGNCNMLEIPVNIRYGFASKGRHNWSVAAGASSYLMNKEDYNYLYDWYGNQYYTYKNYKHSSKDWFSVMQVSVGYERKLGGFGDLRIEPYLKLPFKGVGVAQLPLSSAGIYIILTRPVR